MKKLILFIGSVMLLTSLACGFNFSTANIQSATLARDAEGNDPTTVFNQDDAFYLVAEVANAPDDTVVKAIWSVIEAEGVEPGYVLDERELTGSGGPLHFYVENDLLWPVGRYKVDLFLNDELDRTLEFTVEGDVTAQAEPSPTPEPQPTATPPPPPTPTQASEGSGGDTIALKSTSTPTAASSPTEPPAAAEPEPLPFQDQPYTHASGAFSIAVPQGWEKVDEDDFSVAFGDRQSRVGVIFVDMGASLPEDDVLEFADSSKDIIMESITDDYEVIGDQNSLADNGFYYMGLSFDGGDGAADVFYEPRDNIIFILYFASLQYAAMDPTWSELINSYQIDPAAAGAVAPAENAPPEPPPAPAGPSIPAGKGMLIYYNYTSQDFVIDIIGPTADSAVIPPNSQHEFILDPGNYQYNGHSPGGDFVINTTDFAIVEGQITEKGVQ